MTYVSGVAAYRPMAGGAMVGAANAALEGLAMTAAIQPRAGARERGLAGGGGHPVLERHAARRACRVLQRFLGAKLPARRVGQPEDLAQAIVSVMTNGYITGTVLHVDGGHRLV